MEGMKEFLPHRKRAPRNLGRVLILGLGKSGKALSRYCERLLGSRVESVTVAGGNSSEDSLLFASEMKETSVEFFFDHFEIEGSFDLCIASPGISQFSEFYQNAQSASEEIISEVEFAWRESKSDAIWVAITGTNGKSTTTALTAHLLADGGLKAAPVGNIGNTCTEAVEEGETEIFVTEMSSYQLASTKYFAPQVAVLLNITPDHLSWHKSHEAYVTAKMKVFDNLNENKNAVAIIDATDDEARKVVRHFKSLPPKTRGFSYLPLGTASGLEGDMRLACGSENAAFVKEGELFLAFDGKETSFGAASELQIKGEHNVANSLAAAACASVLGVCARDITASLATFSALEHRIEPCGSVGGIICYNDSKATNSDATLKALAAFGNERPIVLLGGHDKGTNLGELVQGAKDHCKAVVCYGEAKERFFEAFKTSALPSLQADCLAEAFQCALNYAEPGDIVLLSPACASFDEFKDFEHRGRVFKALVGEKKKERGD